MCRLKFAGSGPDCSHIYIYTHVLKGIMIITTQKMNQKKTIFGVCVCDCDWFASFSHDIDLQLP